MKLNIANPGTGAQKMIEIEDEKKLAVFYDKRLSTEIAGDDLGDQFKGYVFKITGGNDKQGFPMMQGVGTTQRVRLLLGKNHKCYRQRRTGERKRKSIRGCIITPEITALSLVVVKKGPQEIEGLTDKSIPRRLGPKRASKIRKLFNLTKEDDVRKYVITREVVREGKKKQIKSPKIQRLVTPLSLQRKRHRLSLKKKRAAKAKADAAEYIKLLAQRGKVKREALISKKRSESVKGSTKGSVKAEAPKAAPKTAAKGAAKVAAKGVTKAAAKAVVKAASKGVTKTTTKAAAKASAKDAAKKAVQKAAAKKTAAKPAATGAKTAAKAGAKTAAKAGAKTAAPKAATKGVTKITQKAAAKTPAKAAAKTVAKKAATKPVVAKAGASKPKAGASKTAAKK